eukprot:6188250-Pleurochrysis_carterae.AAC.3
MAVRSRVWAQYVCGRLCECGVAVRVSECALRKKRNCVYVASAFKGVSATAFAFSGLRLIFIQSSACMQPDTYPPTYPVNTQSQFCHMPSHKVAATESQLQSRSCKVAATKSQPQSRSYNVAAKSAL